MVKSIEQLTREIFGDLNIEYPELQESCPEIIESIQDNLRNYVIEHIKACKEDITENTNIVFKKRTGTYTEIKKRFEVNGGDVYSIDKQSIFNAYPENNII